MDHVFLTDNGSGDGALMLEQLAAMFPADFLTLRTDKYEHAQLKTYAWCVEEHRHRFNWMAFLDMDEFLIVQSGCAAPCPTATPMHAGALKHHHAYAHVACSHGFMVFRPLTQVDPHRSACLCGARAHCIRPPCTPSTVHQQCHRVGVAARHRHM